MKLDTKAAIVLSLIMVVSMLAPPVMATEPDDIPSDQTFTTNNVEVWEESIFTLRHDFEDAPTSVETGDFRAGLGSGGDASLNREFVGVRTAGNDVTLDYDPSRVQLSGADITDSEVQLVAARVTGSGDPVTTFSEAIDLISQENANTNATFEMVDSSRSLSDGETTFTHSEVDAGHYVYFVVDREDGQFSVNDGEIEIATGTPTVIGVEQITFQRGSPEAVSAPAIAEPGDNLSFDIDTTNQFATDDVTHTVLVYDQSKFSDINDGQFTIQVSDRSEIDTDFNLSEDAELFHEIDEVNGVANVEDGIEVNGIDISDGRVSRAVSLGAVVDFVAEDIDGNPPDTTATGNVRLDASVTADARENRDHTVTVETDEDWEPGSYRYVVVSSLESNASAVTTSTGTVSIQDGIEVISQSSSPVDADGSSSVTLGDDSVSAVGFTGLKPGSTASVSRVSSPPTSVTARPDSDSSPTYLEINAEPQSSGSTVTVQTTVSKKQFDNPNNAQVYRYNGSEFVELSTDVVSETSNEVTLQFETGFSLFAIGESSGSGGGGSPPSSGGGGGGGSSSAVFTVSNLTPQDVEVTQGDEITVSATITTDSYLEDTQDVEFRVNGQTIVNQSVSLEDQESTTVEFTGIDTSNLEEGSYEHGIFTSDDNQTATLVVTLPADEETAEEDQQEEQEDQQEEDQQDDEQQEEDATEEEQEPAEETEDGIPGFGAVVALIALIAAALLATRREDQE